MDDNSELIESRYPGDIFYETIYSSTPEEYWSKVLECGWVEGMPEANAAEIKSEIERIFDDGYRDTVMQALSVFEVELSNFGESYTDLLKIIEEATWGTFSPTEIEESEANEIIAISFKSNGSKYALKVPAGRVDDMRIFELVNTALYQRGNKRLLAPVSKGTQQDDWIAIAFVTPEAFYNGRHLGLFPVEEMADFYAVASGEEVDTSFLKPGKNESERMQMVTQLKADPDNYFGWLNLAADYAEEGDEARALKCYQNMVKLHVLDYDTMHTIGKVHMDKGEFDQALVYFKKAVRINPFCHYAWNDVAECYI